MTRTWVFRTYDGWARRVRASDITGAQRVFNEELANREEGFAAYKGEESRPLSSFRPSDFLSCELEYVPQYNLKERR